MFLDTNNGKVEQLKELQEELGRLQSENNRLRQRNDQLEIQLENYLVGEAKGEGRPIHFENNPFADCVMQRSAETEKLQEEVENFSLMSRIFSQHFSIPGGTFETQNQKYGRRS